MYIYHFFCRHVLLKKRQNSYLGILYLIRSSLSMSRLTKGRNIFLKAPCVFQVWYAN